MIFFKSLFVIFLSLTLVACGPVKDFKDQLTERIVGQDPIDPPNDLKEFKAKLNPKILWSLKLGGSETFEFSPSIMGDEVYAASSDGSLAKIDLKTGKIIWKINTGEKLSGGVGVGPNEVTVGTSNGLLVACLHLMTCSSKISGYIDPEPIIPSPPALETAAANSHPEHQIIPA